MEEFRDNSTVRWVHLPEPHAEPPCFSDAIPVIILAATLFVIGAAVGLTGAFANSPPQPGRITTSAVGGALMLCGSMIGFFRMVLAPTRLRRVSTSDCVVGAWLNWRACAMCKRGELEAREKLRVQCRGAFPHAVAAVHCHLHDDLHKSVGQPLQEAEPIRALAPNRGWLEGLALLLLLIVVGCAGSVAPPGGWMVAVALAMGLLWLVSRVISSKPLVAGAGVVEMGDERWTVADSIMIVDRRSLGITVWLVSPVRQTSLDFSSVHNPQFQALWSRWTTSMPRPELRARI